MKRSRRQNVLLFKLKIYSNILKPSPQTPVPPMRRFQSKGVFRILDEKQFSYLNLSKNLHTMCNIRCKVPELSSNPHLVNVIILKQMLLSIDGYCPWKLHRSNNYHIPCQGKTWWNKVETFNVASLFLNSSWQRE